MRHFLLLIMPMLFTLTSVAQGQAGDFPPCSLEDYETLAQIKSDYDPFLRLGHQAIRKSLLVDLVEQHYDWRRGLNDSLPHCREAFEIGWLLSQVSGDVVAAAGLNLADQPTGRVLAPMTRTRLHMEERFKELATSLKQAQATPAPAVAEDLDTACAVGQLEMLAPVILLGFQEIMKMGLAVDNLQDYYSYFDARNTWRDDLWQLLPDCSEAVEYGLLMSQIAGDFVTMYALKMAGISDDENPSVEHVFSDTDRFDVLRQEIIAGLDSDVTVATYYVIAAGRVNIRVCGSTSCDIIGVYDRGDELRVIDDSGDWYQVRLRNGRKGFIAAFLAGANPP